MSEEEIEDIRESFKKLEELQAKVDYYKGLNETITPNVSVEWAYKKLKQNKDE